MRSPKALNNSARVTPWVNRQRGDSYPESEPRKVWSAVASATPLWSALTCQRFGRRRLVAVDGFGQWRLVPSTLR
jgi:hypothetical protein